MTDIVIPKLFAAILAIGFVLPATATIASAKSCKNYTITKSGGKKWTNISARLSARFTWHKYVKKHKGFVWSTYALAASKGYNCKRSGAKWRCKAYGRPCRL